MASEDGLARGSRTRPPPPLATYHSLSYTIRAQALSLCAMFPIISFPMWWGAMVEERGYGLVSFGLLTTAQMIGGLTASIALIFTVKRINRSLVAALLMAVMAMTYLAMTVITDIRIIVLLFGITGAAAAAAASLATLFLGYTANPDRQFALGVTLVTLAQSVIVLALPYLYRWGGNPGIQIFNATILLLNAAVALTLPPCMPDTEQQQAFVEGANQAKTDGAPELIWLAAAPIFIATICFNAYIAVFNYSERIGTARGLTMTTIGSTLSVTMLLGAVGSLGAAWMGKRFGRVLPVVGGTALGVIATILLANDGTGLIGYALGLMIFSTVWALIQPYLTAQTMAIDYSGRVVVAAAPIVQFGGIGTAATITALSAWHGLHGVLWFALAALLICPVGMMLSIALLKPEVARPIHVRWLRLRGKAPAASAEPRYDDVSA